MCNYWKNPAEERGCPVVSDSPQRAHGNARNMKMKKQIFFSTTKGSMNAFMELVGFSAPNKVKNHCASVNVF